MPRPPLSSLRFGSKQEAAQLLQEWVRDILPAAAGAGGPPPARVLAASVGAADSRLQLELSLPSLAALEAVWGAVPGDAHRAWAERMQVGEREGGGGGG